MIINISPISEHFLSALASSCLSLSEGQAVVSSPAAGQAGRSALNK